MATPATSGPGGAELGKLAAPRRLSRLPHGTLGEELAEPYDVGTQERAAFAVRRQLIESIGKHAAQPKAQQDLRPKHQHASLVERGFELLRQRHQAGL